MSARTIKLRYSDDGGRNWSNWREVELGEVGDYTRRLRFRRLGAARQRVWEIEYAPPMKVALLGAVVQAEPADA